MSVKIPPPPLLPFFIVCSSIKKGWGRSQTVTDITPFYSRVEWCNVSNSPPPPPPLHPFFIVCSSIKKGWGWSQTVTDITPFYSLVEWCNVSNSPIPPYPFFSVLWCNVRDTLTPPFFTVWRSIKKGWVVTVTDITPFHSAIHL